MNEQRGCESLFWSQGNLHEWKRQLVRKRQPNCTHQCTPSKTVSIPYEHSHSFIHSPTPKNLQKITCTSMAAMISVTNKQYLYPAHIPVDSALLGLQWHISCQDLGKLQFTRKKKKRKSPKRGSGSCGNRAKCEAHRGMRSPFATPQSFPTPLPFPSLSLCGFGALFPYTTTIIHLVRSLKLLKKWPLSYHNTELAILWSESVAIDTRVTNKPFFMHHDNVEGVVVWVSECRCVSEGDCKSMRDKKASCPLQPSVATCGKKRKKIEVFLVGTCRVLFFT